MKDRLPRTVLAVRDALPERISSKLRGQRFRYSLNDIPAAPLVPEGDVRLLVGPANYAGQGFRWARAAETLPGVGAVSVEAAYEGGFAYPVDLRVPIGVALGSRTWKDKLLTSIVRDFTHVLIEAGRPLFSHSAEEDVARLREAGVRAALVFHGSDIRVPARHRDATPWSPFHPGATVVSAYAAAAERNHELARAAGVPTFVSTPDLLLELPDAAWLPVVIDVDRWQSPRRPFSNPGRPRIAHAPSNSALKGTDFADAAMAAIAGDGLADYVRVSGVPAARMPEVYAGVDVVLDQFTLGIYGVAAVEAMACGRLVVSHVTEQVRREVAGRTGMPLPIIEADPSTLEATLRQLLERPATCLGLSDAGVAFVRANHDGRRSAGALESFLRS